MKVFGDCGVYTLFHYREFFDSVLSYKKSGLSVFMLVSRWRLGKLHGPNYVQLRPLASAFDILGIHFLPCRWLHIRLSIHNSVPFSNLYRLAATWVDSFPIILMWWVFVWVLKMANIGVASASWLIGWNWLDLHWWLHVEMERLSFSSLSYVFEAYLSIVVGVLPYLEGILNKSPRKW